MTRFSYCFRLAVLFSSRGRFTPASHTYCPAVLSNLSVKEVITTFHGYLGVQRDGIDAVRDVEIEAPDSDEPAQWVCLSGDCAEEVTINTKMNPALVANS